MKVRFFPTAFLTLLISCSPDNDRRSGDTGMAEGAPGGLSSRDTMRSAMADTAALGGNTAATPAAVLSQMNVANTMEIQLSTLASKKATSPQVKEIARKLVTHHSRNREEVRALAQEMNVTLTPARGGSVSAGDSAGMPRDLQTRAGPEFDQAFIKHQIDAHQSNVDRIQNQTLPAVEDPRIKAYLQKTLAAMQGHLKSLQQVQQQLGS